MGKVVCVTGASGYIASWLVKLLLQRGYTVKATVRNLSDSSKVEHLTSLEGANERLHLYEINLLEEGSLDSVVDGCDGVFHTASPILFSVSDPQTELIDPAIKGMINVLKSCTKASTIKRVVVTSSMASVMLNYDSLKQDSVIDETWFSDPIFLEEKKTELIDPALKGTINVLKSCTKVSTIKRVVVTSSTASVMYNYDSLKQDFVVDETWFSDPIFCEEKKEWYALSKTLAEKATWKLVEENGLDLVTLHPGYTIGPPLQPTLNLSCVGLLNLIKEVIAYRCVDVRDVALAHVLALENPSASGRYLLVGRVAYSFEALDILKRIYPSLDLPPTEMENRPDKVPYQISKERAESLGVTFRPLEVTLKDSVESFRERNLITF